MEHGVHDPSGIGVVPIVPDAQAKHSILATLENSPNSHVVQRLEGGMEPLVPAGH